MRVAAIELFIEPGRRAAILQAALSAVDRAARIDPAPDLIVLPAFCDVPDILGGDPGSSEYLQGPTVAALSNRARQWGLFICMGMARRMKAGRPRLATVLLDRDGDVLADHHAVCLEGGALECFATGIGYAAAQCLLGRIVPACGPDLMDGGLWEVAGGADVVVAPSCFVTTHRYAAPGRDQLEQTIKTGTKRASVACVIADIVATGAAQHGRSDGWAMIFDRSGALAAGTSPNQGEIIWADLK